MTAKRKRTTIIKPAHFALALSHLSGHIFAGNVKVVADGKKIRAESTGKKYDVTSDFHHILFALADMTPIRHAQGSFTFSTQDRMQHYKVTIKEITNEELAQEAVRALPEQGQENMAVSVEHTNRDVKKLEWHCSSFHAGKEWVAEPIHNFFKYTIIKRNDRGSYSLYLNRDLRQYAADLNEAKRICQTDFETKIKECLQ